MDYLKKKEVLLGLNICKEKKMKNDDLLNLKPKKDLKKPLIYGAIAFLIFIIIVILVAIFQNSSSKSNNEIIPPETQKEIKPESPFQPLNVIEENNSNESSKNTINANNENNESITNNVTTSQNQNVKAENNSSKNMAIQNINEVKNQNIISEQTKPNIKQVNNINEQKNIKNNSKKTNISKQNTKTQKNIHKHKNNKKINKGNYYIQVAALLKNSKPNPKFLKIIKKAGFNYKFYHTIIIRNGNKIKVTKILVGPFRNRNEAKRALIKVKEKITQNAYIFKVKNGI